MTSSRLAQFYQAAGYTVVHSASGSWFNASEQIYHSLPLSLLIEPDKEELRELLLQHHILGVQFANKRGVGLRCLAFMVRDKGFGEASLRRTFRQNLHKAQGCCDVREVDFEELERRGMRVNIDVMARRPYHDPRFIEPALWHRFCHAGQFSPGAGVLGGFVGGELAAYFLYFVEDGTSYGIHLMSRHDLRRHRPNHVLYFEFTRRMIAREDVVAVSTGLQSIPPAFAMDRFKRHAGYVAEPCHLAVALHPLASALLLNPVASRLIDVAGQWFPAEPRLRRVRAVVDVARATRVSNTAAPKTVL